MTFSTSSWMKQQQFWMDSATTRICRRSSKLLKEGVLPFFDQLLEKYKSLPFPGRLTEEENTFSDQLINSPSKDSAWFCRCSALLQEMS
jgi:hypothetical protein